jgi:hypothetical protein
MNLANRRFVLFIYFAIFLILFAGLRPIGFDFDSQNYSNMVFEDNLSVEPTFIFIRFLAKSLTSDKEHAVRIVLLTYAFINILILSIAINKFVKFNVISLFLYFFMAYTMITLTQIRFGVAVAFFVWALYDLTNSNRKGYLFKILLAISFHYSLALAFPLAFLSPTSFNKRFYFVLPLLFCFTILFKDIFLMILINNVGIFSDYLSMKLSRHARGATSLPMLNVLSLFLLFVYYSSLMVVDRVCSTKLNLLLKVLGWGLGFYFLFGFIEVFSKRILFTMAVISVVIIPFVIKKFKNKLLIMVVIIFYGMFYFTNLTVRHGLLDYELYFSHGFL